MNYNEYYAQQVGGALPYFTGSRVQRGHGFGSLLGGLLRTVAPLIKRDVLSGQNIRTAAKRSVKIAGNELLQSLLVTPPGKRVKRAAPKKTYETTNQNHDQKTPTANGRVFLVWRSYTSNRAKV